MQKKINTFMIAFMCAVEFLASTADALDIMELDGLTIMIFVAIQFFFICYNAEIEAEEKEEHVCRKEIIHRGGNDEEDSRRA